MRWSFYVLFVTYLGCAGNKLRLHAWTDLPPVHYAVPPYAQYLAGFKIALDPGHGGLSHLPNYKRGPTGKEEAVMNLNVALLLKEFLQLAGAQVVLTRAEDRFVSLAERAEIAAREKCDFMISLHHNASDRPEANFTSVFYHLHPDYSPVSMDLARAVYFGLAEALRLPEMSPEGLLSDKLIYPSGFGLLRVARMPAILLESSFFSNAGEEQRLVQTEYNRREAYGIFLGLARWAASGLPRATLLQPAAISFTKTPEIIYSLSDGVSERSKRPNGALAIFSQSAIVKLDSETVAAQLNLSKRHLSFQVTAPLQNGAHLVQVELQNLFKQHNLPRVDTIIVASPTDSTHFVAPLQRIPADGVATLPIQLYLFDKDGEPVWDGTRVQVGTVYGAIVHIAMPLQQGRTICYYQSGNTSGPVRIFVEADAHRDTLTLELAPAGELHMLSGFVRDDSTNGSLHAAEITSDDSLFAATDENGFFFVPLITPGERHFSVQARGYHRHSETRTITSEQSAFLNVRLQPIHGGLFHSQHFILDAADAGERHNDTFVSGESVARANLTWAKALSDTLRWMGARVSMIRGADTTIVTQTRIENINMLPQGWYLKLSYHKWERDSTLVQSTIYPGNQAGERLATAIIAAFAPWPHTGSILLRNTSVPEVTLTNKTAVEIVIKCREPEAANRELPALLDGMVKFLQEENKRAQEEDRLAQ